ncbi:hypothetical protein AMAG_10698 [Allomyces macrogynus ATCC 38327]|uniref:Uncharacterized protein n=1 Tax=Allomyces macrogynus (strain ATCC 38327) TaxID=578462 RepID=A0A0L0SRA3_ALLM3|nr:hypothetical protein AMAG_10698 [Allomyces macrogynus ATCC 38327]|eukprot:KNE65031.1 hypothetical protein AMAG_10698 [Allomyces macrogynus ATCC 38327]
MHAIRTLLLWTFLSALCWLVTATTTAIHPPPAFPHPGTFRIHHPCPPILNTSTICTTATWYLHLYPEQQFTVSRTRDLHKWEVAGVWDAVKPTALVLEPNGGGDVRVWEVVGDATEARVRVEERVKWEEQGQARVGERTMMELERVHVGDGQGK